MTDSFGWLVSSSKWHVLVLALLSTCTGACASSSSTQYSIHTPCAGLRMTRNIGVLLFAAVCPAFGWKALHWHRPHHSHSRWNSGYSAFRAPVPGGWLYRTHTHTHEHKIRPCRNVLCRVRYILHAAPFAYFRFVCTRATTTTTNHPFQADTITS